MEFSVEDFVASPSWDKADLLLVANSYDVHVPYSARKAELRLALREELVEKGVLARSAPTVGTTAAVAEAERGTLRTDTGATEVAGVLAAGVEPGLASGSGVGKTSTEDLL